jgi:DNA-binding PadR family transcriptional regulator
VKKAMKRLADDGWVDTRRTFKGNVIRLTAKGKAVLLEEVDRVY